MYPWVQGAQRQGFFKWFGHEMASLPAYLFPLRVHKISTNTIWFSVIRSVQIKKAYSKKNRNRGRYVLLFRGLDECEREIATCQDMMV